MPVVLSSYQSFKFKAHSETIVTYALCGFSNFSSLGMAMGAMCKWHRKTCWTTEWEQRKAMCLKLQINTWFSYLKKNLYYMCRKIQDSTLLLKSKFRRIHWLHLVTSWCMEPKRRYTCYEKTNWSATLTPNSLKCWGCSRKKSQTWTDFSSTKHQCQRLP